MLLIIYFGLIATITSVSGDCDVGTLEVNNFNFTAAGGAWYILKHSPNLLENFLDCVVVTYGPPEGGISSITKHANVIILKIPITIKGEATNWDETGFDENYFPWNIWVGRYYVVAVDYGRYAILKHCCFPLKKPDIYVAYRHQQPDEGTVKDAMKKLHDNDIDDTQLVDWPANNCK